MALLITPDERRGSAEQKKRLFEERSNNCRSDPFLSFFLFPDNRKKRIEGFFVLPQEWKRKSFFITSASSAFNDKEGFYRRKEKSL